MNLVLTNSPRFLCGLQAPGLHLPPLFSFGIIGVHTFAPVLVVVVCFVFLLLFCLAWFLHLHFLFSFFKHSFWS